MMHAAFKIFFFYPFQHFKLHVQEMLQVGIIPLIRYKLVQGLLKILNANYTPILYLVSNSEFVKSFILGTH